MSRILVIDDDEAVRATLRLMLQRGGYDVVVAEDGRAGVTALSMETFDLAIVDIFMPEMEGLETIMAFRRLAPAIPIIAMSGSLPRHGADAAPDFLQMATHFGAAYRLRKPFRSEVAGRAGHACPGEIPQAASLLPNAETRALEECGRWLTVEEGTDTAIRATA